MLYLQFCVVMSLNDSHESLTQNFEHSTTPGHSKLQVFIHIYILINNTQCEENFYTRYALVSWCET